MFKRDNLGFTDLVCVSPSQCTFILTAHHLWLLAALHIQTIQALNSVNHVIASDQPFAAL